MSLRRAIISLLVGVCICAAMSAAADPSRKGRQLHPEFVGIATYRPGGADFDVAARQAKTTAAMGIRTVVFSDLHGLNGAALNNVQKKIGDAQLVGLKQTNYRATKAKLPSWQAAQPIADHNVSIIKNAVGDSKVAIVTLHNFLLGKTPVASLIVRQLSQEHPWHDGRQAAVVDYHHDNVTDERPDVLRGVMQLSGNWDLERGAQMVLPEPSLHPHLVHVTINHEDARLLREGAHRPANRIFVQRNRVDPSNFADGIGVSWQKYTAIVDSQRSYAAANRQRYADGRADQIKLLTSAVVPISRKDIGGLLLLTGLAQQTDRHDRRYQASVAGVDGRHRPYAKWVDTLASKYPLLVGWGRTAWPGSIGEILGSSHAVVMSSNGEGFGYNGVEGWLAGRPVVMRDLPTTGQSFARDGVNLKGGFAYADPWIPLVEAGLSADAIIKAHVDIVRRWGQEHAPLRRLLGMATDRHVRDVVGEQFIQNDAVQHGRLPRAMQEAVYSRLFATRTGKSFSNAIVSRSPHLEQTIDILTRPSKDAWIAKRVHENAEIVNERYGMEHYPESLAAVYDQILNAIAEPPEQPYVDNSLEALEGLIRARGGISAMHAINWESDLP